MTKMSYNWLSAVQIGLIGGVVALLVSLVGMVEEFGKRDIIAGVITMGQTLIFIAFIGAGYLAASRTAGGATLMGLVSGALAGLVQGLSAAWSDTLPAGFMAVIMTIVRVGSKARFHWFMGSFLSLG